ncbi:helix-turn-helix domain-containing protein [Leisingera daeponensis]|uniref:helix-turn-helix domain-containing protein n=1 Tax=Leisingera daeponensis TaxID=405746 RepID=UPI000403DC47|nr:LysR family transcriptional regulator [Leisingera daeponensis]
MNETKLDWDDLRLFLAVAREGGLAAAAASTGKSPPTLGRRMLALERRLGHDLFRRLARGYELTKDGRALVGTAEALESRILSLTTKAASSVPTVKISAGTWVTVNRHAVLTLYRRPKMTPCCALG